MHRWVTTLGVIVAMAVSGGAVVYTAGVQGKELEMACADNRRQDAALEALRQTVADLDKTQGQVLVELKYLNRNLERLTQGGFRAAGGSDGK